MTSPRIYCAAGLAAVLACAGSATAQDGVPKPEELFQRLDKNGDGKLTSDEIPEEQRRFFDRTVRVGDKDGDGVLTREEFIQANRPGDNPSVPLGPLQGGAGRPGQGGGDPRQRFEMMDRNKDGKLTRDELQQVPEQFRERMLQMFERAGKSELTLEEFTRFAGGPPGGGNFQPGEMFNRFDRNGDGKLAKDEIPQEMRERFASAFERLGKDELTREDFAQVAQRIFTPGQPGGTPDGQRPPFLPTIMRLLDANGDGRISKDELAKAAEKFGELDENGDGYLDPRELMGPPPGFAGAPGQSRPNPEGRPNTPPGRPNTPAGRPNANNSTQFFSRLDRNGDGKISKDEAPERMRENFARLDKDGDGFLSAEELRAASEQFGRPDGNGRPRRPGNNEPEKKE